MVSFKMLALILPLLVIQTVRVRAQTASCKSGWGWVRVDVFILTGSKLTWTTLDEQHRRGESLPNRSKPR